MPAKVVAAHIRPFGSGLLISVFSDIGDSEFGEERNVTSREGLRHNDKLNLVVIVQSTSSDPRSFDALVNIMKSLRQDLSPCRRHDSSASCDVAETTASACRPERPLRACAIERR